MSCRDHGGLPKVEGFTPKGGEIHPLKVEGSTPGSPGELLPAAYSKGEVV